MSSWLDLLENNVHFNDIDNTTEFKISVQLHKNQVKGETNFQIT